MTTIKEIDKELQKRGHNARLVRGGSKRNPYFYFIGADAEKFSEATVGGASHLRALSVSQWVDAFEEKRLEG